MDYGIFNMRTDVNACACTWGCMDAVRESALKVDSGRKIPCCTRELILHQQHATPTLDQLSYIPTLKICGTSGTSFVLAACSTALVTGASDAAFTDWLQQRLDIKTQLAPSKPAGNLSLTRCVRYRLKVGMRIMVNRAFNLPGRRAVYCAMHVQERVKTDVGFFYLGWCSHCWHLYLTTSLIRWVLCLRFKDIWRNIPA